MRVASFSKKYQLILLAIGAGIAVAIAMGNVCMGGGGSSVGEDVYAQDTTGHASTANKKRSGGGQRLGGDESSDSMSPRAAAAAAAEARATKGLAGISAEGRRKQELVGRLQELYARRGQDAPFGLPSFSLQRLEQLHAQMKASPA